MAQAEKRYLQAASLSQSVRYSSRSWSSGVRDDVCDATHDDRVLLKLGPSTICIRDLSRPSCTYGMGKRVHLLKNPQALLSLGKGSNLLGSSLLVPWMDDP